MRVFAQRVGATRCIHGDVGGPAGGDDARLLEAIATPSEHRLHLVEAALRGGSSVEEVALASGIDAWFVANESGPIRSFYESLADGSAPEWRLVLVGRGEPASDEEY